MKSVMKLPADAGLVKAITSFGVPKGNAYEFGMGTARNLRECARRGFQTFGYEVDPYWHEEVLKAFSQEGLTGEIVLQDALRVKLEPNTTSVFSVGTVIYWPKSVVFEFFRYLHQSLKPGGVIQCEFPSPKDGSFMGDFFLYTCAPYPEEIHKDSFHHFCDYNCDYDHPGVLGTSMWERGEIQKLVGRLGKYRVIALTLDEWLQNSYDEPMTRSFHRLTIQKLKYK